MSRENVEAVRRTHAAFGRKDYEEMLATDGGGRGLATRHSPAAACVRGWSTCASERAVGTAARFDGDQYLGGKVLVRVLVAQVWTFVGGKAVASRLYDDDRPTYLDVIQATVAAYNRGDLESVLQLVTEDIHLPLSPGTAASRQATHLHAYLGHPLRLWHKHDHCSECATVVDRDDAVVRAEALLARLEAQAERDEDDAVAECRCLQANRGCPREDSNLRPAA